VQAKLAVDLPCRDGVRVQAPKKQSTELRRSDRTHGNDGRKKTGHSQVGGDLRGALGQLVHVEVEGGAALQAEEAAAAAAPLEHGLLLQVVRVVEEHQQVAEQKPEGAAGELLVVTTQAGKKKKRELAQEPFII